MRIFLMLLLAFAATIPGFSQGRFAFNNRVPPDISARFVFAGDAAGVSSIGPDYSVLLYGGSVGTPIDQFRLLDPPSTPFLGPAGSVDAGYVVPVTVTFPGLGPGEEARVLLELSGPGGMGACFGPFAVTLGGSLTDPPYLPLGTQPLFPPIGPGGICIPEPSTALLMGAAALVVCGFSVLKDGRRQSKVGRL